MAASIGAARGKAPRSAPKRRADGKFAGTPPTCAQVCRPNRSEKRIWIPKAVARVYCTSLAEGSTRPEIEKAIEERCGKRVEKKQPVKGGELEAAAAEAEVQLGKSNSLIASARADYVVIESLITALLALGVLLVIGRFARPALVALRAAVQLRQTQLIAQERANALAIAAIQRARAAARAAEEAF